MERFIISNHKGNVSIIDTNNEVTQENLEIFGVELENEVDAKYLAEELYGIVHTLNEQDREIKRLQKIEGG